MLCFWIKFLQELTTETTVLKHCYGNRPLYVTEHTAVICMCVLFLDQSNLVKKAVNSVKILITAAD